MCGRSDVVRHFAEPLLNTTDSAMRYFCLIVLAGLATLALLPARARASVRIKDITDLEGARGNQLYGFGLIVGLDGTGSRSLFTQQVAVDMLQRMNVTAQIFTNLPSDNVLRSSNISAVMITAEIGPFARKGSRLDVTISALDDAKSLQGGTLILTPLRGADGETYAVAQGPVSVGGFLYSGQAASVQKNHPTVGRIAGGAMVEREARGEVVCHGQLRLLLKDPDYATARAITQVINARFPGAAVTVDGGTVQIAALGYKAGTVAAFVDEIGGLEISPDAPARVVINERTGTIVAGEQVKISSVALAHGSLTILTTEEPQVSQPEPFSEGKTRVVPRTKVGVNEQNNGVRVLPRSVTVAELARALNALGATPRDLIAIFQALKLAGALHAEIVVM